MMIDANYTVRQMVKVASFLGARLYGHSRWDGIRRSIRAASRISLSQGW
jgi:hypothetical protein